MQPLFRVTVAALLGTLVLLAVGCGGSSANDDGQPEAAPTATSEEAALSEAEWRERWDGKSSAFLPALKADLNDLKSIGVAVQDEGWSVLPEYGDGWYVSLRGLKACSANLSSLGTPPTPALEEARARMEEACSQYEEAAAMLEAQRGGDTGALTTKILPLMKAADRLRQQAEAAAGAA